MSYLIKGARCIDPSVSLDCVSDIRIKDSQIVEIGTNLQVPLDCEVIDGAGLVALPGAVDIHVHFRDPGFTEKETITTGVAAAAKGGFTDVVTMANTSPVCDNPEVVAYQLNKSAEARLTRVHPAGSATKGLLGKELSPYQELVEAGAICFTDDGQGIQSEEIQRHAMEGVAQVGKTIISHCQDSSIVGKGLCNAHAAARLGLKPWPAQGEEAHIKRDIKLAGETQCAYHVQHITTASGVEEVSQGKRRGINVTCEVTPHHLFLSENDIPLNADANYKMNPPLRTPEDCAALRRALVNGDIDCLVTDHAPHTKEEKHRGFGKAPFGIIGLELSLPLVITNMVLTGELSWARLVEVTSINPRKIVGLEKVGIYIGSTADITIIDPNATFKVSEDYIQSKSTNTPFMGAELTGRPVEVFVDGRHILGAGKVIS